MRTRQQPIAKTGSADPGLRKAAILLSGLDRAAADAMLEAMGPEQAEEVRRATIALGRIDPQEQRRVIDEFFQVRPMMPQQQPSGIELDDRLARRLGMSAGLSTREEQPPSSIDLVADSAADSVGGRTTPFDFLQETEGDKLARVLASERPQTVALVLSHLSSKRAGSVLVRLPAGLQTEVLRRLIELEETDPAVLREVEQALQARLSQQVRMQRRRVAGVQAIAGILAESEGGARMQILDNLAAHDRPLAERLGLRRLAFDDLTRLDDASLRAVFDAAGPETAMTALVGAPPALIDRIVRPLSSGDAAVFRRRLDHPGPIRLSDLERARQQVAEEACQMAVEGRIRLPNERTRAAA